jgi:DNA mismatch repair protein MutS
MAQSETPLMRQYFQIKAKYPDTILLFRMGDFFETFDTDAVLTSKACGITLTKRSSGTVGSNQLAGFPHHQLDNYLPKLVKAGFRVAVCEQLEDPKLAKGIVKRGVVEVVTPGITLYDKLLETDANNYCASVYLFRDKKSTKAGIAFSDISTGEFVTAEVTPNKMAEVLSNISPAELLFSKAQALEIENLMTAYPSKISYTKMEDWIFDQEFTRDILLRQFGTQNLKGFGIEERYSSIASAGALMHYINETQKSAAEHIRSISIYDPTEFMTLDNSTRRNLEILYSNNDDSSSTLISILDSTRTPMGGRLFKTWIARPLKNLKAINSRLNAVEALFNDDDKRDYLRKILDSFGDLERLISKVSTRRANPRDIISLKNSLNLLPLLKDGLSGLNSEMLKELSDSINTLDELAKRIEDLIIDEPSIQIGNGTLFREGIDADLDKYVMAKLHGKEWLNRYQEEQREATGISKLKIGYTSVFGYYLDIYNTNKDKVPASYQRKQTLVNSERYITPELKEFEELMMAAEDKIGTIERRMYEELLTEISRMTFEIQKDAYSIAELDCLQSFAFIARKNNYIKPIIDDGDSMELTEIRHPVVEQLLPEGQSFIPNSTYLDTTEKQIQIITGPNMSGKSCYLRQTALAVFMGQIGSFVAAEKATFGLVDRIFTRVGAQDNITAGESTFLVEMQEAANILNNATSKSLILLDEVGRGTATTDGIALAWAITEFIHNEIRAKTLFATHYHELNSLTDKYEKIQNFRIEVVGTGNNIIFTHNVVAGGSDNSYGIHVAKMAGLPYDVIRRANEILVILDGGGEEEIARPDTKKIKPVKARYEFHNPDQLAIFEVRDDFLRARISELNPDELTPLQALQILTDLYHEVKKR